MAYLLLYGLLLLGVVFVVKPFIQTDSNSGKQKTPTTAGAADGGISASRPLHSSEDCLDPVSERALLDEDGAIERMRLKDIRRAPNGDKLERALYLTLDGHIINPEPRSLYRYGLYVAPVRGAAYRRERDLIDADTSPGSSAILEREPDNEHDPNAIIIRDAASGRHVGYVNKLTAKRVAKILDDDPGALRAVFIRGDGPGIHASPMRILIASPERLRRLFWK